MRVFFDFIDGSYTARDEDGHECESAEAARAELIRALPEVLLSNPQDAAEREVACSVRDERGSVLYRAYVMLRVQEITNLQLH